MASKYTYINFAEDVIGILTGTVEVTQEVGERMIAKAQDLINTQSNKAAYNKANPKKNAAKGASEDTMNKANAIAAVLSDTPMTAADINTALGTEFTALQVANAVKFIDGAQSCKVVRTTVNGKGLKADREYTAYTV
jgi:hypothetical protein